MLNFGERTTVSRLFCPVELCALTEMLYTCNVQYSSHWPHVAVECLKRSQHGILNLLNVLKGCYLKLKEPHVDSHHHSGKHKSQTVRAGNFSC